MLRHRSLTATKQEVGYLEDVAALVELHGPWPRDEELASLAAVRHLLDSTAGLDGAPPTAFRLPQRVRLRVAPGGGPLIVATFFISTPSTGTPT